MSREIGLNVLRLVAVVALVGACGGIGIAEETEEWIADDIFKITSDYGSTIWILDDDTSTMRALFLPFFTTTNRDGFKEIAQALIDAYLGDTYQLSNNDYKINWIQVVAGYGDEMLLLNQKEGETSIFLSIPFLLGGYNGIGLKEQPEGWIGDNVLISKSDFTTYVYFFDDNTSTVRELQFLSANANSLNAFKKDAQSSIDFSYGDDWFTDYTINWVQIAAEYGDEILLLSQKKGENPIFLSIPSLLVGYNGIGTKEKVERITGNDGTAKAWEVMYFGAIDSRVIGNERQKHLDAFIEHNAGVKDACEIMHFHSSTCGYCQSLAPWLDEFRERYPEVLIISYETHESDSIARLEAVKKEYGINSASVPIVFICGSILEGVGAIEDVLEPMALAVYNLPIRNG